jgi:transposase
MEHVAIDLGGRESQICVMSRDGEILLEERRSTRGLKGWLAKRPPSRVVMESCAEAFGIAEAARGAGHDAVVVPASLVRSLGVGSRGVKTDVRDARNLAEASCRMRKLPAVHVPSETSRQRKSICGVREALVGTRTKLVNCLRGWLRTQGAGPIRSGSVETFTRRFLEHAKVREIPVPMAISRVIETIDGINKQIEAADDELDTIAQEDPVCRRLMTAPGVGPVTAVRFAAAIDDVTRFDRASAVQSYLGLVPGEDSSSDRRKVTGITKAGARHVRWALVQAAWSARRWYKSDPIVQWALQIEARRGRHIAIVALARKLAGVLHAMWRRGVDYDPTHASRVPEGANAA